jgi:hypothetical protein
VPEDTVLPHSENTLIHIFVGDEAYLLTTYLTQPWGRILVRSKAIFNYRLSRARRGVESGFRIRASRRRFLNKAVDTEVHIRVGIVKSIYLLHNIIIDFEAYCCLHSRLSQHDPLSLPPTRATRKQCTYKLGRRYLTERPFRTLARYTLRRRTAPFTCMCLSAQVNGRETRVHAGRWHAGHSLRSSSCCSRLPRLPATSIFPWIIRQSPPKTWPIHFIVHRMPIPSFTLRNALFLTQCVQLIFSILLQHHISKS